MRYILVCSLLFVTACDASKPPPKPPVVGAALCPPPPADPDLALLVARSSTIVTGAIDLSPAKLLAHDKTDDAMQAHLDKVKALKGHVSLPVTIDILRFHGKGLSQRDLMAANGSDRIFFLASIEANNHNFILSDMRPITAAAGANTTDAVVREITRQANLLATWKPDTLAPHYTQVRDLIAELAAVQKDTPNAPETQQAILVKIEALGPAAIPAIVALMDDRRPYISRSIAVWSDDPKAWEIWQVGADKIVDALSLVLWKITNESYVPGPGPGEIETDEERDATVAGWRVYASGLSCGTSWKMDSPWGSQAKKRPPNSPLGIML